MKRFEFRLSKVEDYKKKIEEQDKLALGKAERELMAAKAKLSELKEEQAQGFKESVSGSQIESAPTIPYLRILQDRWLEWLSSVIKSAETDVSKKNVEVEIRRSKLIESSKERRIVEKLRERRLAEYNYERSRFDQMIDDECAKGRYIRRDLGDSK